MANNLLSRITALIDDAEKAQHARLTSQQGEDYCKHKQTIADRVYEPFRAGARAR